MFLKNDTHNNRHRHKNHSPNIGTHISTSQIPKVSMKKRNAHMLKIILLLLLAAEVMEDALLSGILVDGESVG